MKYASLKYTNTNNIGDEIQTLAAEQFLPRIDARFDRDKLSILKENERYTVIINGWLSNTPTLAFPPADFIDPLIISIHINRRGKDHFLSEPCLQYFKKHEPIGCRDEETMRMLIQKGINAYFSKCLTITFPKRSSTPVTSKVFLVDLPIHVINIIPKDIGPREYINQETNEYGDLKFEIAKKLLLKYRDEATLVITSRLHCALPCVAMGIPVVLWANPNSTRLEVAKSIGLKIYSDKPMANLNAKVVGILNDFALTNFIIKKIDRLAFVIKYKFLTKIDWQPAVLDIEEDKARLIAQIKKSLKAIEEKAKEGADITT